MSQLVWCEFHAEMGSAIQREYQIKAWKRAWKIEMIEAGNPNWRDLYNDYIPAFSSLSQRKLGSILTYPPG